MYAYAVGVFLLGLLWLFIFFKRKDLRHEQLLLSFFSLPLAPVSQIFWFAADYWHPPYLFAVTIAGVPVGIEEPLFAFFVGGIGAVLYEFVRNRTHRKGAPRSRIALAIFAGVFLFFVVLKSAFSLNTIWASAASLLLGAGVMIYIDKDLLYDSFLTGLFLAFLAFFIYVVLLMFYPDLVSLFWVDKGLSGIFVASVPIEEVVWFFAWGVFSGIVYEFWINVEKYPPIKRRAGFLVGK